MLKIMMKKTGWWRTLIKQIIPSLKIRQIMKNRIQRANISAFNQPQISQVERQNIYNSYFKQDVHNLEELLKRKMYWD